MGETQIEEVEEDSRDCHPIEFLRDLLDKQAEGDWDFEVEIIEECRVWLDKVEKLEGAFEHE